MVGRRLIVLTASIETTCSPIVSLMHRKYVFLMTILIYFFDLLFEWFLRSENIVLYNFIWFSSCFAFFCDILRKIIWELFVKLCPKSQFLPSLCETAVEHVFNKPLNWIDLGIKNNSLHRVSRVHLGKEIQKDCSKNIISNKQLTNKRTKGNGLSRWFRLRRASREGKRVMFQWEDHGQKAFRLKIHTGIIRETIILFFRCYCHMSTLHNR